MRKSIPVSDDLEKYFKDPCPILSDNNSQMIFDEIGKGYDYVVEYGMGSSTLYFLNACEDFKTTFISVENNFNWFELCIEQTKKQTAFKEIAYEEKPWSMSDFNAFINWQGEAADIPEKFCRIHRWKDSLALGPFFRFSPEAKSRFSGRLGPLWPISKPLLKFAAKAYFAFCVRARPYTGEWCGKKENLELILRNVGPSIKDQFGEAPNMMDYINAGLKDIRIGLVNGKTISAVIIIDGGPRHKIVQEIFKLEKQYMTFNPTIILCDACRGFYKTTLDKRPLGQFIKGSNKTLKGYPVVTEENCGGDALWCGGKTTIDEFAAEEVWYYKVVKAA